VILTDIDHRLLREEAAVSPAFGRKLEAMIDRPNGVALLNDSARRAVLNELNPREYPKSKGEWTVLRKQMRILLRDIPKSIDESLSKLSLEEKTRMLEAYAMGGVQVHAQMAEYPVESLGQIAEIIGAVVGAASSVYGAKLQSNTQKQIAKIQAAGEAKSLEANMTIAKAQMALQAAQVASIQQQTAAIESGTTLPGATPEIAAAIAAKKAELASPGGSIMAAITKDIGGGVPLVVPVVGVLGTVLYFVFKG